MPDKDPATLMEYLRQAFPYLTTIVLASWGGAVKYLQSVRNRKEPFSVWAFLMEMSIAAFAGLVTHFLCVYAGIEGAGRSVLVSISGYMGTLALEPLTHFYKRIVGSTK